MVIIAAKDLTGQKFGKLTILNRVDNQVSNGRIKARWRVQCDCGNIFETNTSNITAGKNQCWDCAHKETGLKKRKEIVGQTFGYLTVLSVDRRIVKGRHRTYCLCKCKCGKEIEVLMDSLMRKGLHSCGCGRKESADKLSRNIDNMTFGRLSVIEEIKEMTPRRVRCKCECGNELIVKKTDLMAGHTQSCGCLQSENTSKANLKSWTGYVSEWGITLNKQEYKNEHGTWMWDCTCHCGNHFIELPAYIVSGHRKSCGCMNISAGEKLIDDFLNEHNIKHKTEYSFPDCADIYVLRFDCAILKNDDSAKALIEYDGRQHYEPIEWFGGEETFRIRQEHDRIKDEYCAKNDIPLFRIPYYLTADEIKERLTNIIQL